MMAVFRSGRAEHRRIKLGGIEGHGRDIPPPPLVTDPDAWARRLASLSEVIGCNNTGFSRRTVDVLTQFPWYSTPPSSKGVRP